jgi:peptide/nickel transport system permease protein
VNTTLLILLAWLLAALCSPWFGDAAIQVDLPSILAAPGTAGLLGRDELGRDVLARVMGGAGTALWVSLLVVSVSALAGTGIGLAAGYLGGWMDRIASRVIDVFLAFPGILLAIALAAVLGPGLGNLVLALSLMGWVGFARLARAQAMTLRQREHVQAAQALGAGHTRIIGRHLLPLALAPILVEASFGVANVVIAEAGLSFLGLGVQPPDASWGSMIRDGVRYMLVAPHLVLAPGTALCLVVFAVNRLGDRLRDRADVFAQRT